MMLIPLLGLAPERRIVVFLLHVAHSVAQCRHRLARRSQRCFSIAANGMGYNPWQRLFRIELPLALPLIISGIRIAVVTVIGHRDGGCIH